MRNNRFFAGTLVLLTIFAASCDRLPVQEEEKGLSEKPGLAEALKSMADEAEKSGENLSSVAVWQNGYRMSGVWLGGNKSDTRFPVWSVTKTFTAAAVGIAESEGLLKLSDKVAPLFPDEVSEAEAGMTDEQKANLEALTIEHLLTMTNGHKKDPTTEYAKDCLKSNPTLVLKHVSKSGIDLEGFLNESEISTTIPKLFFNFPFDVEPGTRFCYDSFGSCILSEIISMKTGGTLAYYLDSRLFQPLGLQSPVWDSVHGVSAGGWGLHLTTGEMILFGRLLLSDGRWNGRQLISESYLKAATTTHIDKSKNYGEEYETTGYGYQMWTRDDGSLYLAIGMLGQYIVVIPDKNAVIAMTSTASSLLEAVMSSTSSESEKPLELAWKYIVPVL